MPSEFNFPPKVERYCHPCEHLKFANAVYGHDFVRGDYECLHPNAEPEIRQNPELAAIIGRRGRSIGKEDNRPCWCPLYNHEA